MEYNEEDYLMLSGIQHFVFCRRQWALIHIEQQWDENYRTTSGNLMHKRAHQENLFELRGNILTAHSMRISSKTLGITGQCDVVEFHKDIQGIELYGYEGLWRIVPIEYKRGEPKPGGEDEMQLCLQAMCLEEQFLTTIPEGYLYYGENRRRTKVVFSEDMRIKVRELVLEMHNMFKRGYTPNVKPTSKCKACSLYGLCLPQMFKNETVKSYIDRHIGEEEQL